MVGTTRAASSVAPAAGRRGAAVPLPLRMAAMAEGRSLAAPQARPECTPTAA